MFRSLLQHATSRSKQRHYNCTSRPAGGSRPMNNRDVELSTITGTKRWFHKSSFFDGVATGIQPTCSRSSQLLQNLSTPQRPNNGGRYIYEKFIPSTLFRKLYHTSTTRLFGLEDFRDSIPRQQREMEPVGRSWSASELRRKSYDDLHKLWYVLYKERNMLLTEQQLSRRKQLNFPQPDRIQKVRRSMGAIKHVLGERKREHLFRVKAAREEQQTRNDDNENEHLPQSA